MPDQTNVGNASNPENYQSPEGDEDKKQNAQAILNKTYSSQKTNNNNHLLVVNGDGLAIPSNQER